MNNIFYFMLGFIVCLIWIEIIKEYNKYKNRGN